MYDSDEDYDDYENRNDFYDSSDNELEDGLYGQDDPLYDDDFYEEEFHLFENWDEISLEEYNIAFNGNRNLQIKIKTQLGLSFQQYDRYRRLKEKLLSHSDHWASISKCISASSRGISSFRKISGRRSYMEDFYWNDKDEHFYPASFDDTYIHRESVFKHKSLKDEDILSEDQLSLHVWFNLKFRKMVICNDLDDKFISVHDVYREHLVQLKMKKIEAKKEQRKGKKKKRSGRIKNIITSFSSGSSGLKNTRNLDGVLPSCSSDNGEENFTYKISSIKKQSSDSLPPIYSNNIIPQAPAADITVVLFSSETSCIGGVTSTVHDSTDIIKQQQQKELNMIIRSDNKNGGEASSISVCHLHNLKTVGVSVSSSYNDENNSCSSTADRNLDGVLLSCPSDNGSLNFTKGISTSTNKKQSSVSSFPTSDLTSQFAQSQQKMNGNNNFVGLVEGKKAKGRNRPGKKERAALKEITSAEL